MAQWRRGTLFAFVLLRRRRDGRIRPLRTATEFAQFEGLQNLTLAPISTATALS